MPDETPIFERLPDFVARADGDYRAADQPEDAIKVQAIKDDIYIYERRHFNRFRIEDSGEVAGRKSMKREYTGRTHRAKENDRCRMEREYIDREYVERGKMISGYYEEWSIHLETQAYFTHLDRYIVPETELAVGAGILPAINLFIEGAGIPSMYFGTGLTAGSGGVLAPAAFAASEAAIVFFATTALIDAVSDIEAKKRSDGWELVGRYYEQAEPTGETTTGWEATEEWRSCRPRVNEVIADRRVQVVGALALAAVALFAITAGGDEEPPQAFFGQPQATAVAADATASGQSGDAGGSSDASDVAGPFAQLGRFQAEMVFSGGADECGYGAGFVDTLEIAVEDSTITITQPSTGDSNSGALQSDGSFFASQSNPPESYQGVLREDGSGEAVNRYTDSDGCESVWQVRWEAPN